MSNAHEAAMAIADLLGKHGSSALEAIADACDACADVTSPIARRHWLETGRLLRVASRRADRAEACGDWVTLADGADIIADMADDCAADEPHDEPGDGRDYILGTNEAKP